MTEVSKDRRGRSGGHVVGVTVLSGRTGVPSKTGNEMIRGTGTEKLCVTIKIKGREEIDVQPRYCQNPPTRPGETSISIRRHL